jgi:hypothetical protein
VLTPAEIAAAEGDDLTRLQLRLLDAGLEESRAQTALLQQQVAQGNVALNKPQQLWFDLYALHLRTRREPAIITSATTDTVVKDIVLDAAAMTAEVFPHVSAAMAALEPPGSNVFVQIGQASLSVPA